MNFSNIAAPIITGIGAYTIAAGIQTATQLYLYKEKRQIEQENEKKHLEQTAVLQEMQKENLSLQSKVLPPPEGYPVQNRSICYYVEILRQLPTHATSTKVISDITACKHFQEKNFRVQYEQYDKKAIFIASYLNTCFRQAKTIEECHKCTLPFTPKYRANNKISN
ncbi:MAG: hypothetical protein K0S74_1189 [Chlamydiales bacterium]|jgi:hypothetical protein|nr:hypothetical protein [Chlamydiales bacterium]